MFSESNSEALNALDNSQYGSVNQGDSDTGGGEAANQRGSDTTAMPEGRIIIYVDTQVESCGGARRGLDRHPRSRCSLPATEFAELK